MGCYTGDIEWWMKEGARNGTLGISLRDLSEETWRKVSFTRDPDRYAN